MKDNLDNINPVSKTLLVIGIVLLAVATLGAIYWTLDNNYSVLFNKLDSRDAALIVEQLEKQEVPYQLADNGTTIKVAQDDVHQVRLQLMNSEAKLISGVGFELFDGSDFGMTEFVQKINYQRALQGELSRTIASLDEIKYARVHLVMPESSLFKKEGNQSTASVTVFLKEGAVLGGSQVAGIQRLVASAVPDMDKNSVIVVNQNGVALSKNSTQNGSPEMVSDRLRMRQEVEQYLAQKANSVLEKAFGPNQALVNVDVSLDLDRIQSTTEDVIAPDDKEDVLYRRRVTKSNVEKKQDKVSTESEYKLGKKIKQVVSAPGGVRQISVGIVVPGDTPKSRIHKIEQLVAASVGLDTKRGDQIVVHAVEFSGNPQQRINTLADVGTGTRVMPRNQMHDVSKEGLDQEMRGFIDTILPRNAHAASEVRQEETLNQAQVFQVLLIFFGLVSLGLLVFLLRPRKVVEQGILSEAERMRLLQQMQQWINNSDKTGVNDKVESK